MFSTLVFLSCPEFGLLFKMILEYRTVLVELITSDRSMHFSIWLELHWKQVTYIKFVSIENSLSYENIIVLRISSFDIDTAEFQYWKNRLEHFLVNSNILLFIHFKHLYFFQFHFSHFIVFFTVVFMLLLLLHIPKSQNSNTIRKINMSAEEIEHLC